MTDIAIGTLAEGGEALLLDRFRPVGTVIVGQTGMGKTSLMRLLIQADIVAGTSAIVIDPHGDLVEDLLGSLPAEFVANVFVLEVDPAHPFGLNLFEGDQTDLIVDQVVEVFKKLWGVEQWVHIEYLLRNVSRTLLASEKPTMANVPLLFADPEFRRVLVRGLNRPMVTNFWSEYEDIRRPQDRVMFRQPLMNKVDRFLSPEFLGQVFSSPVTSVNLREIMDNGQTLLVRFPVGLVGEEATKILGSVLLQLIFREALKRADRHDRPRVHLYLDEYGRFATPTTSSLLKEGRKFGIGTTIAFQTLADLDDEENRAAVLQVGNLMIFQVIGQDAHQLALNLKVVPEEETVGLTEKRVIANSVVDHLLREGHEDDLSKALDRWVRPLADALNRTFEVPHLTEVCPFVEREDIRVLCSRQRVSQALSLLDRYFVAMQQRACTDTQEIEFLERLTVLLGPLIGYLAEGYYQQSYRIPEGIDHSGGTRSRLQMQIFPEQFVECPMTAEERAWIHELVVLFVAGWHIMVELPERKMPIILAFEMDDPAVKEYQRMYDELMKRCPIRTERTGSVKRGGWAYHPAGDQYLVIDKPVTFTSVYAGEEAAGQIRLFLLQIKKIAQAVWFKPVLTGSGQFEEVKRFKPISDAQNKLEVQLATLPRYHAYVQLETPAGSVEGMASIRNVEWSKVDEAMTQQIRDQSRRRFATFPDEETVEANGELSHEPTPGFPRLQRRRRIT